ncbi:MAG: DUF302 domain-containing protein [Methyloligellaceae bacterium]
MKKLFLALLVCLSLPFTTAFADDKNLVIKESAHSVSETIDKLKTVLESKGITIFARIDHAAGAKKVGEALEPTELLIFGNPKLGTPLMQSNQKIGLDLPLKAIAWKGKDGKVRLGYPSPAYLKTKYGITDKDAVFTKITGALGKFTDAAVK